MNVKKVVWAAALSGALCGCLSGEADAFEKNVASGMKTPETSKHFRKYTDSVSGAVSYILETRIAENQQSFYFTHNSMTDDGRFLLFSQSGGKFREAHILGMVDFMKDEVFSLDTPGWMPFIDQATDRMYRVNDRGFFYRDLQADAMQDVFVCAIPEAIKAEGKKIFRYCTHLTLTPDRKKAFLDLRIDDKFVQGVVDLEKGTWEKWNEETFHINHGQLNPVNGDLALCAYERVPWTDTKGVEHRGLVLENGVYPRLQLISKGKRQMIPAQAKNTASHEKWTADGKGFYWCGRGVWYHDLATGEQTNLVPFRASHATMTADRRYVTFDDRAGNRGYYRGQPWKVAFWNRVLNKGVWIFSDLPAYNTPENPSKLHPDPHPQFVCRDRYIVSTVNHGDGRMDIAVTPVAPLAALTVEKDASVLLPQRLSDL